MLTVQQANSSMARILAQLHLKEDDAMEYVRSISEACRGMNPVEFEDVCKELAANMNQRKPPAAAFKATSKGLSAIRGWDSKGYREVRPLTEEEKRQEMDRSVAWCHAEIEHRYTPEAAHDLLEWLNDNPRQAAHVTQPAMEALLLKSAKADPALLKERKRIRDRGKVFQKIMESL